MNLTEEKTSLRSGIFLPQQRQHTTTQETTNFILKCAGWTQHIFRRTAAFPPHAGKTDCIIAPHRASHPLQSYLEYNKEIRGNTLATENCQLLEIINPFKCWRNILSQSCGLWSWHSSYWREIPSSLARKHEAATCADEMLGLGFLHRSFYHLHQLKEPGENNGLSQRLREEGSCSSIVINCRLLFTGRKNFF